MELTTDWYLALSVAMFAIGAVGLMVRRNPLVMFMCVELMLNAVNVSFVAIGAELNDAGGQVAAFFVLVVADSGLGVAAAPMIGWIAVKMAVSWQRRKGTEASDLGPIISMSQASNFGNLISMLFAGLGGLICAWSIGSP